MKLKPCPFCKSDDTYFERGDFVSGYITCNNCCARGPIGEERGDDEGKRDATKLWNRRLRRAEQTEASDE